MTRMTAELTQTKIGLTSTKMFGSMPSQRVWHRDIQGRPILVIFLALLIVSIGGKAGVIAYDPAGLFCQLIFGGLALIALAALQSLHGVRYFLGTITISLIGSLVVLGSL